MKVLILSAGHGRRLLPLTENTPKCILPLMGQSLIEWQIGHNHFPAMNQTQVFCSRACKFSD